jgi:BirA family biotin operon repressor/biotin-[acetyl-CoA-carboxylase] ligase
MSGSDIHRIVLGIGVNFTAPEGGFPEEISHTAGAVFSDKPTTTRNRLAAEIINRMAVLGKNDASVCETTLIEKYRSRLMMLGKKITVTSAGQAYEATAIDINNKGQLIVKTENGETRLLVAGEISVRQSFTPQA